MSKLENPVLMGVIGAAQGLRGEVRVKVFTADPLAFGDYGHLHSADGRVFEVLDLREAKNVVIVRFRGVNDRTAAEALNGLELFIDRNALPDEDLDEDEFFYADLEGLDVFDASGKSYGAVTAVFDFGAGDLLEVKGPGKRPVLIPFSEAAVLEIDLEAGKLLIDPIAAGLVDENPDDPFDPEGRIDRKGPQKKNPGSKGDGA
ncbi:ribosome maturation factor RimM [Allorhizobium sp. BGMRC 0089]|uniref:ribosome maturation factor RimM n=1 Tax=Allorhizobium sonneratiae TaxID=2934936 RepID=UPI0020338C26|nr:ribosome maturation factor RimM [Allorhizobium sonneratiae]MCM2293401.1 ribosome maturation factor RimM [Allorhizobium sonneratiae]